MKTRANRSNWTAGKIAAMFGTVTLFQRDDRAVHVNTVTAGNVVAGACSQIERVDAVWTTDVTVTDLYDLDGLVCDKCWRSVFPLPVSGPPAPLKNIERNSPAFLPTDYAAR